jgi:hypothetical protein
MTFPLALHCYGQSLAKLQPQHPRLFIHDADLPAFRAAILADPFEKRQYEELLGVGKALLNVPPDAYEIKGPEHTLLTTARDVEGRVILLAGLYRISGYKPFAQRATQEMLAAANFPDWFPSHFLDTAEMTTGLGIGYDWLYAELSVKDRNTIKNAIVQKGIDPWLTHVREGKAHYANNWSQVCNGGETVGALAIAEDEPVRANAVVDSARVSMASIMKTFAPDGGFEEGPIYWNYATVYNVLYISALDSSVGDDFGASEAPGFALTPDYHIQSTGPTYQSANFGDAGAGSFPAPQMYWFAYQYHQPRFAVEEREIDLRAKGVTAEKLEGSRFLLLGLYWNTKVVIPAHVPTLPLVQSFSRIDQAYMRSSWSEQDAWYIGFKGGDARANHGHLDLGSFVFDALGQRWAIDLAGDSYGLPGYFKQQRWTYYRTRTEGHNTLTIDGENEDLDADAHMSTSVGQGGVEFSILDLQQAYKGKVKAWKRGVALFGDQRLLVQDELTPVGTADIVWNFHTYARVVISPDRHSAKLRQGGKEIEVRILEPSNASFDTAGTSAPAPQASNQGVTNLVMQLDRQSTAQTITVLFTQPGDITTPSIGALSTWH